MELGGTAFVAIAAPPTRRRRVSLVTAIAGGAFLLAVAGCSNIPQAPTGGGIYPTGPGLYRIPFIPEDLRDKTEPETIEVRSPTASLV